MPKKTAAATKTNAARAAREMKVMNGGGAKRRSVAEAAPPNALDLAMQEQGEEEEDEVVEPKPAAKPVGSLVKRAPTPAVETDFIVDTDDDDDADDDGDDEAPASGAAPTAAAVGESGGNAVNAKFWAEAAKLGPAHAKSVTTRKTRMRVLRILKAVGRWDVGGEENMLKAIKALEGADALLAQAINAFDMVDSAWRPKKAKRAPQEASKLAAGTVVRIRDKVLAGYTELEEDPSVFSRLVVKMHTGSKVVATTEDGTRYVFPRGHVLVVKKDAPAEDDTDEDDDT